MRRVKLPKMLFAGLFFIVGLVGTKEVALGEVFVLQGEKCNLSQCTNCTPVCTSGKTCQAGACKCLPNQANCNNICVDTKNDSNHCGSCGIKCSSGQVCFRGACTTICSTGQTNCSGSCAVLETDAKHCGSCGNVCGSGKDCCARSCVNMQTDTNNCGTCGKQCGSGQTCIKGLCCATGLSNCNGSCQNLQNSRTNCGSCGTACSSSMTCINGVCSNMTFIGGSLLTKKQMAQINTWHSTPNQKWTLCYKATVHTAGPRDFHARCDGKGPTITVAQLNKGKSSERLIGGYNNESWGGSNRYMGNNTAFLFSLTNNFKHVAFGPKHYVYTATGYSATWGGGHDLFLGYDAGLTSALCRLGVTYSCRIGTNGSQQCIDDFCGKLTPQVNDIEVYYKAP